MKKKELLARIERLEMQVDLLNAQRCHCHHLYGGAIPTRPWVSPTYEPYTITCGSVEVTS